MASQLWTVVLAAGAGRRLAELTGGVPKQFWRAGDRKSLLEATTDRFAALAPPSRTVVIVDKSHRDHVSTSLDPARIGEVVFQPEDRGTATGVLLALTPVLATEPEAIVTITPADHGVVNDDRFRRGLLEAARHVQSHGGIVVFGVEPTGARDDYGWITPASPSSHRLRPVTAFIEKPSTQVAEGLFASGAVWNTMVVVARASALHALYVELLPELASVFAAAQQLSPAARQAFLSDVYPHLPSLDFSRDLLGPARNLLTYVWPASIGWSDLGTPERLREWQRGAVARVRPRISAA